MDIFFFILFFQIHGIVNFYIWHIVAMSLVLAFNRSGIKGS